MLLGQDYAMGMMGSPGASGGMGSDSIGGVPGIGGYARGGYGPGRMPGGWGGGLLGRAGGYTPGFPGPMLPPGGGNPMPPASPIPNTSPGAANWLGGNLPNAGQNEALTPMLHALISQHLRQMLANGGQPLQKRLGMPQGGPQGGLGQGQPPNPMMGLGQPQQAAPSPFGQPARFGGQGPPGGGAPNLMMNSPGP